MEMLDNIHATLEMNGNLTSELKENIFELVIIFNKTFPEVNLSNLNNKLSDLKIKKINKLISNNISKYDVRSNTIYLNNEYLNKGYDAKHILMFELLNVITYNGTQVGFDRDGEFEALNAGYTEILTNYLVGNDGDELIYPDEAIETNLISVMIGNDVLKQAYFNNNTDLLIEGFKKVGFEV